MSVKNGDFLYLYHIFLSRTFLLGRKKILHVAGEKFRMNKTKCQSNDNYFHSQSFRGKWKTLWFNMNISEWLPVKAIVVESTLRFIHSESTTLNNKNVGYNQVWHLKKGLNPSILFRWMKTLFLEFALN